METKIILPVGKVETKAWPETNFLLSILKNTPFGWDWVMNTHIQLRCSVFYGRKWNKNRAMSDIRYVTGYKGKLIKKRCSCGNCSPILEVFRGRGNDWIHMSNGTKLHPYSLLQIINEVNFRMDYSILQYQLIQEK